MGRRKRDGERRSRGKEEQGQSLVFLSELCPKNWEKKRKWAILLKKVVSILGKREEEKSEV